MNKVKNIAFVYLAQGSGEYYMTDDPGYSVQRRPQLGLQYLCAVLKKIDIKTDIFDQTVSSFDLNWLIAKLNEYSIVGFYCSDPQEDKVKAYCKKIKETLNIPIVVGGPSTLRNPTFLDHGCDIVVHGEGEITVQQIVDYYNGKRKLEDIKGISYKQNNAIISAPPQELIKDLDELPFPDRSKLDINAYYDYFLFGIKTPYTTMICSRGCLYRCSYCTSCDIWGYKYRRRSVDNVLSEIDEVVEKYNMKYIAFQDDIFGVRNEWIEEFCTKLLERPYRIKWMVIFHPFSLRTETERILRLMKKAGCDTLSFGLQSAHPEILKNINRKPDEAQKLKKILKAADKLGFVTAVSYIFGLPGDTRDTIQTSIDYSLSCGSTLASYYILSLLRGSELEKQYRDKKICDLTHEELNTLTAAASKKFYMRPVALLTLAYFIVSNPGWIIKVGAKLPSILARVGFFNKN